MLVPCMEWEDMPTMASPMATPQEDHHILKQPIMDIRSISSIIPKIRMEILMVAVMVPILRVMALLLPIHLPLVGAMPVIPTIEEQVEHRKALLPTMAAVVLVLVVLLRPHRLLRNKHLLVDLPMEHRPIREVHLPPLMNGIQITLEVLHHPMVMLHHLLMEDHPCGIHDQVPILWKVVGILVVVVLAGLLLRRVELVAGELPLLQNHLLRDQGEHHHVDHHLEEEEKDAPLRYVCPLVVPMVEEPI